MNWNRKDKEPIETLQIIKEILEKIGRAHV